MTKLQEMTAEELQAVWTTAYEAFQVSATDAVKATLDEIWAEFVARKAS